MKQIIAYLKPNMLSKVAMALHDLEGLRGDGEIHVVTIEEALRISTGEKGENAI